MADAHLPDKFFDLVAQLPLEPPRVGSKGSRPCVPHRMAVRVIWFVLVSGYRWEDVPRELGCSGRTTHRRLRGWEELGVWDRVHADLFGLLKRAGTLDADTVIVGGVIVRAFGGVEGTGSSPVVRRKPGTKYTLLVDRRAGAAGGAIRRGERQRPHPTVPGGAGLPEGERHPRPAEATAGRGIRRPRV